MNVSRLAADCSQHGLRVVHLYVRIKTLCNTGNMSYSCSAVCWRITVFQELFHSGPDDQIAKCCRHEMNIAHLHRDASTSPLHGV